MVERTEIFGFKIGKKFIPIFKIPKFCFHKKSLLGLLETVSGREQWYCPICKKIYSKERRYTMKITKGQTALIVIAIAGTIGALIVVNLFKAHPIYGASILIATLGVVIGSLMYKRNKDK